MQHYLSIGRYYGYLLEVHYFINSKLEEKQPQKAEAAEDVSKTSDDTSAISTEFAQEPKHEVNKLPTDNKLTCP